MGIIEVETLSKRYPGAAAPAVDGISFAVNEREIFGILGPNGAGKTTLLSMLSCIVSPDAGDASIGGQSITESPSKVKQLIGIVPQELALYPRLSARDNLLFFGGLYGERGAGLRRRVTDALAMVGLAERAGDRVETLSGGMKRRVNIAAGLVHEPRVLFLDEPTVGVDPQSRNFIFDSIEALRRGGMTIVYVTHYMEEAQRLCDRVAIVDHGRVIALDAPRALVDAHGGIVALTVAEGESLADDSRLSLVEGVSRVVRQENRILVHAPDPSAALARVVEVATEVGFRIQAVEIREHNLESVFLDLTGRRLRD